MKVELEGLRKHLKNNKIIALPRVKYDKNPYHSQICILC